MGRRRTTTIRGYGILHQNERNRVKAVIDQGQGWCVLCGDWIHPNANWHLDHTPDRTGYRGPAHAHCNTSDGARRGNATRRRRNPPSRWKL